MSRSAVLAAAAAATNARRRRSVRNALDTPTATAPTSTSTSTPNGSTPPSSTSNDETVDLIVPIQNPKNIDEINWRHPAEHVFVTPEQTSQQHIIPLLLTQAFSVPARPAPGEKFVYITSRAGQVKIPAGYRIPLLFCGKYLWESVRLVLASEDPEGEWEKFNLNILNLSLLCHSFLESAKAAEGRKGKGRMSPGWRNMTFDRVLTRFYWGWLVNRDEYIRAFWMEFKEEEYERDVCRREWEATTLTGHNGFHLTQSEIDKGISMDEYTAGLKPVYSNSSPDTIVGYRWDNAAMENALTYEYASPGPGDADSSDDFEKDSQANEDSDVEMEMEMEMGDSTAQLSSSQSLPAWRHPLEHKFVIPSQTSQFHIISRLLQQDFSAPGRPPASWRFICVDWTDDDYVVIPVRYRVPLMFCGKYIWESVRLAMTSDDPEVWRKIDLDVFNLSLACHQFLERAKKAKDRKKGWMTPRWRDTTFDRVLTRVYFGWFGNRDEHIRAFWMQFKDEEYKKDVCRRDWVSMALVGHNGFHLTKDEINWGIKSDRFTYGLKDVYENDSSNKVVGYRWEKDAVPPPCQGSLFAPHSEPRTGTPTAPNVSSPQPQPQPQPQIQLTSSSPNEFTQSLASIASSLSLPYLPSASSTLGTSTPIAIPRPNGSGGEGSTSPHPGPGVVNAAPRAVVAIANTTVSAPRPVLNASTSPRPPVLQKTPPKYVNRPFIVFPTSGSVGVGAGAGSYQAQTRSGQASSAVGAVGAQGGLVQTVAGLPSESGDVVHAPSGDQSKEPDPPVLPPISDEEDEDEEVVDPPMLPPVSDSESDEEEVNNVLAVHDVVYGSAVVGQGNAALSGGQEVHGNGDLQEMDDRMVVDHPAETVMSDTSPSGNSGIARNGIEEDGMVVDAPTTSDQGPSADSISPTSKDISPTPNSNSSALSSNNQVPTSFQLPADVLFTPSNPEVLDRILDVVPTMLNQLYSLLAASRTSESSDDASASGAVEHESGTLVNTLVHRIKSLENEIKTNKEEFISRKKETENMRRKVVELEERVKNYEIARRNNSDLVAKTGVVSQSHERYTTPLSRTSSISVEEGDGPLPIKSRRKVMSLRGIEESRPSSAAGV